MPYLLSDKPPQIDGKHLELEFELRAPATLKIPEQPDGYSIRVSLYADNRQSDFAFIDWNGITKNAEHVTVPGNVPLLTHSKSRSLLASIGNEPAASQFIELKNLSPAPLIEPLVPSDTEIDFENGETFPSLRRSIRGSVECVALLRLHCRRFTDNRPKAPDSSVAVVCDRPVSGFREQLSEHKRQNPAVPVIIDLDWRIDPKVYRH